MTGQGCLGKAPLYGVASPCIFLVYVLLIFFDDQFSHLVNFYHLQIVDVVIDAEVSTGFENSNVVDLVTGLHNFFILGHDRLVYPMVLQTKQILGLHGYSTSTMISPTSSIFTSTDSGKTPLYIISIQTLAKSIHLQFSVALSQHNGLPATLVMWLIHSLVSISYGIFLNLIQIG